MQHEKNSLSEIIVGLDYFESIFNMLVAQI